MLFIVLLLILFQCGGTQSFQTNSELIYKGNIKKNSKTHLPAYFTKAITRLLKDSTRSKAKKGGYRSKRKCSYHIDIDYQYIYIY